MNNGQDTGSPFTGTWINRISGESVKVRNSIINGDSFVVLTDDGRSIDGSEFSRNWCRLDMNDEELVNLTERIRSEADEVQRVSDIRNPKDNRRLIKKESGVLDRIFAKTRLTLTVDASLLALPCEALKVATEYLDITFDDIKEYINSNVKIEITGLEGCLGLAE